MLNKCSKTTTMTMNPWLKLKTKRTPSHFFIEDSSRFDSRTTLPRPPPGAYCRGRWPFRCRPSTSWGFRSWLSPETWAPSWSSRSGWRLQRWGGRKLGSFDRISWPTCGSNTGGYKWQEIRGAKSKGFECSNLHIVDDIVLILFKAGWHNRTCFCLCSEYPFKFEKAV